MFALSTYTDLLSPIQKLSIQCSQPLIYRVPGDFARFNDWGVMVNLHGAVFAPPEFFPYHQVKN